MRRFEEQIFPVLLSGGAGTRLWPLSRKSAPKQLINLVGSKTLFQQAVLRIVNSALFNPPTVVASWEHRLSVADQLHESGVMEASIMLEPIARNTAAAAAVAALQIAETASEGLMLLMPADHLIENGPLFREAILAAIPAALDGYLTLFGIRPDRPATGYGYIRMGDSISVGEKVRHADAFVEKPDAPTAERYLKSGDHLWNSGIVLALAGTFLEELRMHSPEVLDAARAAFERASHDDGFIGIDAAAYAKSPVISLDHAVLERSSRVAVVPAEFPWRDVGSWSALWEAAERDSDNNAISGAVITEATINSYIRSEGPLIATLGVEGLIVVATGDAVLIASADRDQDIRKIVERLQDARQEYI